MRSARRWERCGKKVGSLWGRYACAEVESGESFASLGEGAIRGHGWRMGLPWMLRAQQAGSSRKADNRFGMASSSATTWRSETRLCANKIKPDERIFRF